MSDIESLRNTVQAQNGIISRLKHELQSVEYALGDARINLTMTAAEVAHEMRCELDTLREAVDKYGDGFDWVQRAMQAEAELDALRDDLETEKCLSFRNQVAELQAELDALKAREPVGVFADVNRHVPGQPPRWEQMIPESWDGDEYVYLYAAPKPGDGNDPR